MVLKVSRGIALKALVVSATGVPTALSAQSLPEVAPAIGREDPEYDPVPATAGGLQLSVDGDVQIEYDDNIFALPDAPTSDGIFIYSSQSELTHRSGSFTAGLLAGFTARRYLDEVEQNSEAGKVQLGLAWEPREAETLFLDASWERSIEDRGDPEARQSAALGPRQIDISSVRTGYRRAQGKLLLDLGAEATKFDARAAIDDDRDFAVYGGTAKLGMRVGGRMFATASGFVTHRDFRLPVSSQGIDRDATIYGGRVGVDFLPGGFLEGSVSAGLFRSEPSDPTLDSRTGLSVAGLLTYRPTRRAAFILDGSRGDVATFRGGASGRTDTTVRLTWQQEIRHNLFSSVSAGYRDSKFIDAGISEDTVIASASAEYLVDRNFSLVGRVGYGSRDSDLPLEEFDRFRGSVGVRFRF